MPNNKTTAERVVGHVPLRGWSEGDEDCPVPGMATWTDELCQEAKKYDPWQSKGYPKPVPVEDQVMESPLFYSVKKERNRLGFLGDQRHQAQVRFASRVLKEKNVKLVLMTNDFKVIVASSLLALLWFYLKSKLARKPKVPKKRPIPTYED